MADKVELKELSMEFAVLQVMKHIAGNETGVTKDRKYYLTHRQCWKAAHGSPLERILKED
jgi:hypothetical protein